MNGNLAEVGRRMHEVIAEVERAVVGKREALALLAVGVLADGHVLLEDLPGLAKTLTAKSFARALGLEFKRIQFTPDLLPADVTGTHVFNPQTAAFELKKGPVFTNLLLGDEVNRAPPKTQAALLEAMQEGQVTLDGELLPLPRPFLVLATQNPIEFEGTYPLPEAQLDRFLMRVAVGYPDGESEAEILRRRAERRQEVVELDRVISAEALLELREAVETVHVDGDVLRYMVALTAATREEPRVQVGASPRGSLALLKLARAHAALEGRDYVLPDDVKRVAVPALAHRLILEPDLWLKPHAAEDIVAAILDQVPVPKLPQGAAPPGS